MSKVSLVALIAAGCMAAPATVLAQSWMSMDWTPTGDRILSDPTYLPLRGQIYGDTSYDYSALRSRTAGVDGLGSSSHLDSNIINQTLSLGLTDDLTVRAGVAYDWSQTHGVNGFGAFGHNNNGFENPTVGVTWRVLDQRSRPVSLDLSADYAPDFLTAYPYGPGRDGSVARGGDALRLGVALGREMRFMTAQVFFDDRHYGGTTENQGAPGPYGPIATSTGYWQPEVGLNTQTRFAPRLSLNVGGAYDFKAQSQEISGFNGVPTYRDPGDFGLVRVGLNYHIVPGRLVGSVNYAHTFYADKGVSHPFLPADDYNLSRSEDTVGAQLRYTFR